MKKALEILNRIKEGTFINGHISELKSIDEAISELEEAMKPKTCDGCKHKPNEGECYYEPCGTCARFFYDHYEPKETKC